MDFVVSQPEEKLSARDQFNIIRHNFLIVLVAGAIGVGWQYNQQRDMVPMYLSTATIRFNDMRSNLTSGVGSAATSQGAWVVDPIKSELELLRSSATAEDAVDRGKLQFAEVAPIGAVSWIDSIDAAAVQGSDTLRVTFGDSSVSAALGKDRATAAYGTKLIVGPVSFVVPFRPPSPAAVFVVYPRDATKSRVSGGITFARRTDTDVSDVSFTDGDPYFTPRECYPATDS